MRVTSWRVVDLTLIASFPMCGGDLKQLGINEIEILVPRGTGVTLGLAATLRFAASVSRVWGDDERAKQRPGVCFLL